MYSILNKQINLRLLSISNTSKRDEHFIGVNMITEKPTKATHKLFYVYLSIQYEYNIYKVLKTQCVVFELYHDCISLPHRIIIYFMFTSVPSLFLRFQNYYSISISYYYCLLLFYDTKENVYQSNYFSES